MNMHFKIAFGGAAVLALVLTVGTMRTTASVEEEPLPLPKSDSIIAMRKAGFEALQMAMSSEPPKVVQTETIVPPIVVPAEPPETKKKHKVKTVAHDICRGKGKRYTHGHRSWRCRK
jgi:hypothetical protein